MFSHFKNNSIQRLIVVAILVLSVSVASCMSREYILVYSGPGADEKCIQQTVIMLIKHNIHSHYKIRTIDSNYLLNEQWEDITKLLVMPGGSDLPYKNILNGYGNNKIQRFVKGGGSYLGICAGAYYAGSGIE